MLSEEGVVKKKIMEGDEEGRGGQSEGGGYC